MILLVILLAIALAASAAVHGYKQAQSIQSSYSRPIYYGAYFALYAALPMIFISTGWLLAELFIYKPVVMTILAEDIGNATNELFRYVEVTQIAHGILQQSDNAITNKAAEAYLNIVQTTDYYLVAFLFISGILGWRVAAKQCSKQLKAREKVEKFIRIFLAASSGVAVLTTFGIVLSLLVETLKFFQHVPVFDFLFGLHWSPQTALRADQAGSSGTFGAVPLLSGTLLIACIAMLIAVPIGLYSAIYLAEYANSRVRASIKPTLEILAGIPTVVYGFFAALTVAPFIVSVARDIGVDASSENALAAGIIMGVMIIPFISSLSEDVISSVPQNLRDGSLAMGATKAETIKKVVLPAALPGIVSSILLGFSRAVGETMIVVMAAGLAANMTINPLESVTTVTAQIVTILVGDQSFDSPKTLAAFALGLTLFSLTLFLNLIALKVVRKYREQYD